MADTKVFKAKVVITKYKPGSRTFLSKKSRMIKSLGVMVHTLEFTDLGVDYQVEVWERVLFKKWTARSGSILYKGADLAIVDTPTDIHVSANTYMDVAKLEEAIATVQSYLPPSRIYYGEDFYHKTKCVTVKANQVYRGTIQEAIPPLVVLVHMSTLLGREITLTLK